MYAATKHAVLGFTGSLQGDLIDAGIPITVHALCPDAADTPLLREHDHEPAAAINWSGPRLLTADEVADHAVALLDSKKLVRVVPAWRGWGARAMSMAGRPALRAAPVLRKQGDRHRVAFRHDERHQRPPAATAAGTIEVENPATGKVIASVPVVAPEQVAAAGCARPARPARAGRRSASTAAPR